MTANYTLTVGDLAYLDTFSGLVPCKVIAVSADLTHATVKVTARRDGHKAGDEVEARPNVTLIHRSQVVTRSGQFYIRGTVSLVKETP